MIKEREPRLLSIGSAVRFTHNGVTIHGHLLQRQGRRRFAKVIDNQEQTWKVPESALKDTGGTRRTTMVTPHDEVRAKLPTGRSSSIPRSRRPDARRDCQTQPEESESALWGGMLERPLWPARCRRGASCEERRGAVDLHHGDGPAIDG